jgi:hypothetical protein
VGNRLVLLAGRLLPNPCDSRQNHGRPVVHPSIGRAGPGVIRERWRSQRTSTLPCIDRPPETPAYKEHREILRLFGRAKRGEAITDEEIQLLREYRDRLLSADAIAHARRNP